MNIAEPLIRIEKRLESLLNDFKGLKEDLNKVNQSLDNLTVIGKPKEKKYRPYSLAEWIVQHDIGDAIHFRNKKSGTIYCGMYVGNVRLKDTDIVNSSEGMLSLGVDNFALDYLFEDYEIEIDGEWKPFGVLDEEKE